MKFNLNVVKRIIPVAVGLLVLPLFAQTAKADVVAFACGGSGASSVLPCSGTVSTSYSSPITLTSASTTGVGVVQLAGPADDSVLSGAVFTLAFDTSTGSISLTETAGADTSTLTGTILNFIGFQSPTENNVDLSVNWSGLPADFAAFLGTPTGTGITTNVDLNTDNSATEASVSITPTPEPGSLVLLGSGLLSFGGFLRRRMVKA